LKFQNLDVKNKDCEEKFEHNVNDVYLNRRISNMSKVGVECFRLFLSLRFSLLSS